MLDVRTGNFSTTRVRDSSEVTTLLDSTPGHADRVLRKTDEHKLKTVVDLANNRVVSNQSWPWQRTLLEQIQ